ncbi:DUF6867 family protein [Azospirillum ramasamyi]|uniref:DUF6867 domain-containing protein n=1 Tax=Azospirillum ramasamyi TaxID=682998 RepID=A0A2U9SJ37_9PROT|nr:hypothetical protein [Azospirillum ramasamyi]AWU97668.1 hypothetical protein DM194_25575 [Azospirillum ramasamyi]
METILGSSVPVFVFLTVLVFGGCGVLTGQTLAEGWKPVSSVLAYSLLLGVGDRFLAWGLFGEQLLSLWGFAVHTAVIALITLTAHRIATARRMVNQYPWLYERAGPFAWREKTGAATDE